ncbi:hypothetical protein A2U01_0028008, partial [Trifolium medium]|nr:hypothetical protein [Trifolium medium]
MEWTPELEDLRK